MKAQDVRPGTALNIDGQVWLIVKTDHVKPGKGPAYTQVKMRNVASGSHQEKRLRGSEEVDAVNIDRRDIEYLYSDGSGAIFMDCETFEQSTIPDEILGDAMQYLKPNTVVTGLVYSGNVLAMELPAVVDLEITDTQPAIKGATATNQLKEAVCETGLKTRVPPFIKQGEVVRIKTETGEYVGRVSE